MIVVDTNIVAYHLLRTEPFAQEVHRLAEEEPDWSAPPLIRSELRNLLTLQYRERGLSISEVKRLTEQAERLFANALFDVESEEIFELVTQSNLSAYDCEYVALSRRLETPLLTYDETILDTFPNTAAAPSDFLDESSRT